MAASLPGGLENVDSEQVKSVSFYKVVKEFLTPTVVASMKFRDFLVSYNKLSEICFNDCVWDFTTRNVKDQENRCALNCMEKYMKMNQRVSQRFQEFQMIANENALAAAQKMSTVAR